MDSRADCCIGMAMSCGRDGKGKIACMLQTDSNAWCQGALQRCTSHTELKVETQRGPLLN